MNRRWSRRIAAAIGAVVVAGCAAPSPSPSPPSDDEPQSSGRFPSASDLDRLAEKPAPQRLELQRELDVETWKLVGPFPEHLQIELRAVDTPWDSLLSEAARQRPGLLLQTEAMHCVAREAGLFYLDHQAQPGPGLQRYITSRCNAAVPAYRAATLYTRVPESASEQEVFDRWRESVAESIRQLTVGGPGTVGVWYGRNGQEVLVMVVAGTRAVHVDPVETILEPGSTVFITGEALLPVDAVSAIISRARFGFAICNADPNVALPRFAFECVPDPSDESAIISVGYTPPGRLIAKSGVNLLLFPGGRPSAEYRLFSYSSERIVSDADTAGAQFVEVLNEVRGDAGLESLQEAPAQSAIASSLAPHFFSALLGNSAETDADLVALGMIAGWGVDGILQSGRFAWSVAGATRDVGRLLSTILEYPVGRQVLLDPEAEKIAVGAIVDPGGEASSMAVLVGTYTLFSESAHAKNAEGVYVRFQKARAEHGLQPAKRLEQIGPMSMEAAGLVQAGLEPRQAFDQLLQSSSAALRRPVSGWLAEVSDLDDLEFPEDFVSRASLEIAVGVAYRRPDPEPWGRYVVMVVVAESRSHSL
jgi:hypothetical protein